MAKAWHPGGRREGEYSEVEAKTTCKFSREQYLQYKRWYDNPCADPKTCPNP
jgi:hypothetical protein